MKVSVIVPIYNVEKYLCRCLDSLLSQTYKNLEVILVNDGSTDASGSIADTYAAKNPNFKVVHKENGGVSESRNIGLSYASGAYICFVDADDFIEPDAIEKMVTAIHATQADLVMSAYYIDYAEEQYTIECNLKNEQQYYTKQELSAAIYAMENNNFNVLWNKLYVREIIQNHSLKFLPELNTGEDLVFNCEYMQYVRSVSFVFDKTYHYMRQGEDSLAGKYQENLYDQVQRCNRARKRMYDFFGMDALPYKEMYAKTFCEYIFSCIPNLYKKQCKVKRRDQKTLLRGILNTPKLGEYLNMIPQKTGYFKLLHILYLLRNTHFAIWITDILFFVRYKMEPLYKKIRKKINEG